MLSVALFCRKAGAAAQPREDRVDNSGDQFPRDHGNTYGEPHFHDDKNSVRKRARTRPVRSIIPVTPLRMQQAGIPSYHGDPGGSLQMEFPSLPYEVMAETVMGLG